ncbi:MAG: zinc-dependent alcohol dehydrogenase [Thermomicrobiales bacterium]
MPRELLAVAPRTPVLSEYEESPLGERQIRVRTEFASPKHGTELVGYRDEPSARRVYDPGWGAVMPLTEAQQQRRFPMRLGNMAVGIVTDAGSSVTRFAVGDRVFGHFPIRETQTVDETRADPLPDGLSPEAAVCLDPAVMAMAIRDAGIKLGDRIAVFGLGAIGLLAVQIARIAGADWVVAVDPIAERRALALAFGADEALDPRAGDGDAGLAIRRLTAPNGETSDGAMPRESILGGYWEKPTQVGELGVDVAVEVSGSSQALHQAIRATRFGGTICVLSFYGGEAAGLRLGEEFHVNRLQFVSARAESLPLRDAPGWTLERLVEVTLRWLTSGRLRADGVVTPIVPFAESIEAYRAIDEHPERSIKLGVRFG